MDKLKLNIRKIVAFLVLICLFSCKNEEIIEYYKDKKTINKRYFVNSDGQKQGVYKEFYKSGKLKNISIYDKDIKKDSSMFYSNLGELEKVVYFKKNKEFAKEFQNNVLIAEGIIENDIKIGKWNYFNKFSKKEKVLEYINLCGSQYLNQGWYFNKDGDTIKERSNYLTVRLDKSILKRNDTINLFFEYFPFLSKKPTLIACQSNNLDNKFCNIDKSSLDTIITQSTKFKRSLLFKDKGTYFIRGFVQEHNNLAIDNKKDYKIRYVYYSLNLKVTE
jgi:antitoxin component YwqK of YwqJK toxin-antitoxin module